MGRQRAMYAEGHLLLLLHAPPEPGRAEREARLFWRNVRGEWRSSQNGASVIALKNHLQDFDDRLDQLETQVAAADSADDFFRILRAVAPLHRTCRNAHAALQQARELLPDERDLIVLRDKAGELERTAELIHQEMIHGLDYATAKRSEEQAALGHRMAVASHRLNILAAMFLPIATLSAVLGMSNIKHGLEDADTPYTFFAVLGGGLLAGVLTSAIIVRQPPALGN